MGKKLLLFSLVFLCSSLSAHAAGFADTWGFGSRAVSLGGAFTAVADDYSAAYYNPAGLAQTSKNYFTIDYMYTSPQIKIEKSNGDDLLTYSQANGPVRTNPTEYKGSTRGLDLSIPLMGLGLAVNDIVNCPINIQFGMAMSLPEHNDTMYRIMSYPVDQPHLIRYGDNIDRIHLAIGIGVEAWKDLVYVGIGAQQMLYGDGMIYVDGMNMTSPNGEAIAEVQQSNLLKSDLTAGILVTPLDKKLKIGFSFRDKEQVEVDPLPTLINTGLLDDSYIGIVMGLWAFYTPREFSLGASYDFDFLLVSAEANLQQWSDYDVMPEEKVNNISKDKVAGLPDFKDTINYRLGVEWRPIKNASVSLGYFYQQSPVPDQSGRVSNYIDMDKNTFSLGGKYTFNVPFALNKPMTIGGMFSYQLLEKLTVDKTGVTGITYKQQNGSNMEESYTVEGSAYAGGINLSFSW
jgi:long-chain fatty acid transport protein